MSSFFPRRALWILFATLLAAAGYAALAACDFGLRPLFGLRYCKADQPADALAAERARQRELLARLHEADLRNAEKPICQPPSPPPPVERHEAEKQPDLGPREELTIPQRKEDLEGCWQSARGDIPFYTDDEKHEYTGSARICYCFGRNGRGVVRQTFMLGPEAGSVCQTRLRAVLKPDELLFEHPEVPCTKGSPVNAATIECRSAEDKTATCELRYKSRIHEEPTTETFARVPNDYCGWRPGR